MWEKCTGTCDSSQSNAFLLLMDHTEQWIGSGNWVTIYQTMIASSPRRTHGPSAQNSERPQLAVHLLLWRLASLVRASSGNESKLSFP